ncbi:S-layer homology domain-containing protein [Paenibacillus sp. FSL H7-0331]|uniref:S-layer homology domain-containing protein n=1 Tax=Paenibacillus sp. FSL H7-0331 TaxID=1920421 RepID=UPI00096C6F08|nr:S-layer homology domain-containing protein [Paenibacillus sp. FSL H7-0331]OMF02680.1 hypothetical protein BK127_36875 [Paenibacillus sp. FSL H7-0331]
MIYHHPFFKRVLTGILAMAVLLPYIPASLSSSSTVSAAPVIPANPSGVVMVEDFENVNLADLYLDQARIYSASMSLETNPKYVRNGAKSLRIDYDFIGITDNPSQVAVGPATQLPLTNRVPKKIGMWVYANNEGHGLTSKFYIPSGSSRTYEIRDEVTGIDWSGWKYVEAPIGADMTVPGTLAFYFQMKERQMSKKNKGSIWIDDVRLIYDEPVSEDMTVPVISPTSPTPNQTLNAPISSITLSADDVGLSGNGQSVTSATYASGIDPNSIRLSVNGQSVSSATYAYDLNNKLITYHPNTPLDGGYYEVHATIKDKSGNPATADYSFNIEHGVRYTMEAPEESLSSEIYRLQLGAKDVGAAKSAHVKLKFDPATLQAKAITGRSDLTNVQTNIDNVGGFVTFNADGLQGNNVQPLASIDFEFSRTAKMERGEMFKQIRMAEGSFGYTGGTSVNSFAAPINYKIGFPYKMAIKGAGLQTQSVITVTNHSGAPVAGAAIEFNDANGPQTYVTVTAANSKIYKSADSASSVLLTVKKDQQFFATTGSTSGFVSVFTPDGTKKGFIPSADVQQNDLKQGLGLTDSKGEILTSLLTLAIGTWRVQAVKDGSTSESMNMEIVSQFGDENPQYVQTFVNENMGTMMSVGWQTAPRVQQTTIQYVKDSDFANASEKLIEQVAKYEVQVMQNVNNGPLGEIKFHKALVTGLEPSTKYHYRVGYEGHWSAWNEYKTADSALDKPVSFVYVTDSHTKGDNGLEAYQKLLKNAFANYPNAQFIMHGGDIVDDGKLSDEWNQFWKASSFYATSIPSGYTMGNHDVKGEGKEVFVKGLELPNNGPENQKKYVYSFDSGEVHFTVLNSEADAVTMAKQAEWLREDIKKSDKKWKMVMFHKPVYHTESGRSELIEDSRTYFAPILEELEVDLVLVGHDHVYSRTYPMKKGKPLLNGERGTVYLDGGASGWKFYDGTKYAYLDFMFDDDVPVYSAIQVSHDKISIQAHTVNGDMFDNYSIEKKDAAVTSVSVSPASASVVQGATQQLTAAVTVVSGAKQTVTWTSSDSKVAVDANGLVTVAADAATGNYSITATSTVDSSKKGTATITVIAAPVVTSVSVSPASAIVAQGATQQLTATVTVVGGAEQTVTWTSSDSKVTVDANGLVTVTADAVRGDYTITATSTFDSSKKGTAVINAIPRRSSPSTGSPSTGTPTTDTPSTGTPSTGTPSTGTPSTGTPSTGTPTPKSFFNEKVNIDLIRALVEKEKTAPAVTFKDVPANAQYAKAIVLAAKLGIIEGYADGSFHASATVTRAEFATILVKALGLVSEGGSSFEDTKGHWAANTITILKASGIINGYQDGTFKPNESISRAEIVAMLSRVMNTTLVKEAKFKDVSGNWAEGEINTLSGMGIVQGTDDGSFKPNANATRLESLLMLMRMLNVSLGHTLDLE